MHRNLTKCIAVSQKSHAKAVSEAEAQAKRSSRALSAAKKKLSIACSLDPRLHVLLVCKDRGGHVHHWARNSPQISDWCANVGPGGLLSVVKEVYGNCDETSCGSSFDVCFQAIT